MFNFGKNKQQKEYEKQSFDARIEMEKRAQMDLMARLKVIELQVKNQARLG